MTRPQKKQQAETMPKKSSRVRKSREVLPYGAAFLSHKGNSSDKWEQYLSVYESELSEYLLQGKPLRLLEIGVQNGGSLEIWEKVLPAGSTIIGMDIDPRCRRLALKSNITILIGDASNPKALDDLLGDKQFDIIVDDGSHQQAEITSTFQSLFPRLIDGGVYFLEDLHSSYWQSHGGGLRRPGTAIEYLKTLVDAQNFSHFQNDEVRKAQFDAEFRTLHSRVARIAFYDSIAVVNKYSTPRTVPFHRIVSGSQMRVTHPSDYVKVLSATPGAFTAINGVEDILLQEAAKELSIVKDELSSLRVTNEKLKNEAQSHQPPAPAHDPRVGELEAALALNAARASTLEESVRERDTRIAELESGGTENHLSTLQSRIDYHESKSEQLEIALASATQEAEALQLQITAYEDRITELDAPLAASSTASDELRQMLAEKESRVEKLEQALAMSSKSTDVARNGLVAASVSVEQLRGQLAERDARIAEIEPALVANAAAMDELRQRLAEKERRVGKLEHALAMSSKSTEVAHNSLVAASASVEQLRGQLAERDARMAEIEPALMASAAAMDELRRRISERNAQLFEAKQSLDAATEAVAGLQGELADNNVRVEKLKRALAGTSIAMDAVRHAQSEEAAALRLEIAERDSQIIEFDLAYAAASSTAADIRTELSENRARYEVRIEKLKQVLSESTLATDKARNRSSEYKSRVLFLEEQLETARNTHTAMLTAQAAALDTISQELAQLNLRERQGRLVIDNLTRSLAQVHSAWVFKLDAALVRSARLSAFGLAKPRQPLLLAAPRKETDINQNT